MADPVVPSSPHPHRQLSRMSGQIDRSGVGTGGGANGQPHQQPVEDAAGLIPGTSTDQLQLRTTMRVRILEYVSTTPSLAVWLPRLPELVKWLEETLYTKFPNKNDYCDMMKGPVGPQLQFAIMTLSAPNQQNPQMFGQTAELNQVSSSSVVVGVGGADGILQHQLMQDTAAMSRMDQQFVMLRTAMREKTFDCIGKKQIQMSAEWRKWLPELAKRLEDILYRTFPKKNDYSNMMKGPIEPQLKFAIKTFSAQNQQNRKKPQVERQTPPSSSSNLVKVKNPLHVSKGQIHKKLRCRFCKKTGHFKKDCLNRKKWFEKKGIPYDPTHKRT